MLRWKSHTRWTNTISEAARLRKPLHSIQMCYRYGQQLDQRPDSRVVGRLLMRKQVPVPIHPPQSLVDAVLRKKCVVFVGAGLSAPAGLPTWPTLLQTMLDAAPLSPDEKQGLEALLHRGELLLVAEELHEHLGEGPFRNRLRAQISKPGRQPTDAHRLLASIPFVAALTTNYDTLLEAAYSQIHGVQPHSFTHQDSGELADALRDDRFYLLKLHGDVNRANTMILTRADYRRIMHNNPAYRYHLSSIFSSKAVLFLGFSLTDPDLLMLLDENAAVLRDYVGTHHAVVSTDDPGGIMAGRLRRDYGIVLHRYTPSGPGHPEAVEFLKELQEQVVWRHRPNALCFYMLNKATGRCLDAPAERDNSGLQQWVLLDRINQQWYFERVGGDDFVIYSAYSKNCLTADVPAQRVRQRPYHGSESQHWTLVPSDDGIEFAPAAHSELRLDADWGGQYPDGDGKPVTLYSHTAAPNQRWHLRPALGEPAF